MPQSKTAVTSLNMIFENLHFIVVVCLLFLSFNLCFFNARTPSIKRTKYNAYLNVDFTAIITVDTTKAENVPSNNTRQRQLLYPQICSLLIELLATSPGAAYHEVLCYSLNHLISLAKSSKSNCVGLYQSGLPGILLRCYDDVLASKGETTQGM